MIRLLKYGCLFVTSHALIITNNGSLDVFLKISPACHDVHHQPSIMIPANSKQYLPPSQNHTSLCVMVQVTQDNEEQIQLMKTRNTLNAQLRITEHNGKLVVETAFC